MRSMTNIADLYHAKHGYYPDLSTLSMAEIHALHDELQGWKLYHSQKEQTVYKPRIMPALSAFATIVLSLSCMILGLIVAAQTTSNGQLLINENKTAALTALALVMGGNLIVLLALTCKPHK